MREKTKKSASIIKNYILKHSNLIVSLTFFIAILDCNSTCSYVLGQPKLPKECEKLKKYV